MTVSPPWTAFESSNAIGDPGRQPEILAVSGSLNVGVPDTALDFLTVGPLEVRACSSRGWSHRYKGSPRQDSHSLLVNEDLLVVAVADGVSEGDFSQVAAETAARSACKLAADQIARTGSVDWIQLGRRISLRIIEEGEYRQIVTVPAPEDSIDQRLTACLAKMATTLLVAVIERAADHRGYAAEIAVVAGDSAAYLVSDGALTALGGGKDPSESITSGRVRPLPGVVEPQVVQQWLRPGEALVLGTDGLGDPVGDGSGDMGLELARRWRQPPSIDQFLLDVNVYRRSYDDDRTAVGVWLRPDAELPPAEQPAQSSTDPDDPADGATSRANQAEPQGAAAVDATTADGDKD